MQVTTIALIALISYFEIVDSFYHNYHNGILVRTARSLSSISMASQEDFSDLTKKLLEKKVTAEPTKQVTVAVPKVESKPKQTAPVPKAVVVPKPEASKVTTASVKTTAPVVVKKAEPVKVVAPVAQKVEKIIEVPSTPPPSAVASSIDVVLGFGLGLAPYLAIPIILFNSAKSLFKKPKPLPVVEAPKPKVSPYSKSLGEGLKEGFDELLSGKSTPDLELTRKGIKLSIGGFAVAALFTGVLVTLNGGEKSETKVVAPAPVKVAPTPKPAPAPVKVVAPAPVPAPKPEPVKVAPVPIPAPVPAPAPKVEPVKEAPVPVPAPAPAPKPEPVKEAPAPVPAATPAEEGVDVYVPPKPVKGLEADTVDLSTLKSLRVSASSLLLAKFQSIRFTKFFLLFLDFRNLENRCPMTRTTMP